ncbi:MAG TPA: PorV/PorQ family protein [Ignavibacteria bacterium]|nr:PorV/PorQ family protein [Ignavibacteria bacterium]
MARSKFILTIILLFFSVALLKAQNEGPGNTGFAVLKLGVGARPIAMGEAFSSISDDATAVIYNPARLSFIDKSNVIVMHNEVMQDVTNNFIAAKFPLSSKLVLGFGLLSTSITGIEIRNIPGAAIDNFDANNLSAGLSFGYKASPNIFVGITGKYLYEKIYVDDASGFAFDFGGNYVKNNVSFALVFSNLGSVNSLLNLETNIPAAVRFGGSYKISKEKLSFLFGLDGYKVLDGGNFHVNAGGEAGFKDMVFLRLGYQTQYENKGFTSGVGFKYKAVYFDYAFVPYSSGFGNSNTFSLGLNF